MPRRTAVVTITELVEVPAAGGCGVQSLPSGGSSLSHRQPSLLAFKHGVALKDRLPGDASLRCRLKAVIVASAIACPRTRGFGPRVDSAPSKCRSRTHRDPRAPRAPDVVACNDGDGVWPSGKRALPVEVRCAAVAPTVAAHLRERADARRRNRRTLSQALGRPRLGGRHRRSKGPRRRSGRRRRGTTPNTRSPSQPKGSRQRGNPSTPSGADAKPPPGNAPRQRRDHALRD